MTNISLVPLTALLSSPRTMTLSLTSTRSRITLERAASSSLLTVPTSLLLLALVLVWPLAESIVSFSYISSRYNNTNMLSACGMNTLHVHPRSAELQVVTSGRLITEMVPENGVLDKDGKRRVIRTELTANMMTPFYQGSIHTQFNPDCEPATFIATFATEDFGTGQIADELVSLSDDVIAATFGQSIAGEDIDKVRQAVPKSIALGVDKCLETCGLKKRSI